MDKLLCFILAIVPLVGFIYGRIVFRKKKVLYLRMIIDGVGSIALGRIFEFVKLLTENESPEGFHIGVLSMFGVFAFFLSANFGQIDTLCDDGTSKFKKYRFVAIIAPAFIFLNYILLLGKIDSNEVKFVYGIFCALIGFADYFHLKMLLLPDVDFGIAKCLRPFNALAILYSLLCVAEIFIMSEGCSMVISILLYTVMIIVSGLLVPVTVKGVKKWTI